MKTIIKTALAVASFVLFSCHQNPNTSYREGAVVVAKVLTWENVNGEAKQAIKNYYIPVSYKINHHDQLVTFYDAIDERAEKIETLAFSLSNLISISAADHSIQMAVKAKQDEKGRWNPLTPREYLEVIHNAIKKQ